MSENGDHRDNTRHEDDEHIRRRDDRYDEDDASNYRPKDDDHAEDIFSIHVSGDEVGLKLNEEALKSFFEKFGEVADVSVIRDPATRTSRRFGFLRMARLEDAHRVVAEMEKGLIDGFEVRCSRARRTSAHEKTPGQYLGPPSLSSKFIRDRRERDRRRDRSRDRPRDRPRSRERERSRDRFPPREFDRYREEDRFRDRDYDRPIYRDPRDLRFDPRGFDPRDPRAYDYGRPRFDDPRDPRGPPPFIPGPSAYDMRPLSPQYGRGRSPPRADDRVHVPPMDGGRAPPVAGYAASSYYAGSGSSGGRAGPPRY